MYRIDLKQQTRDTTHLNANRNLNFHIRASFVFHWKATPYALIFFSRFPVNFYLLPFPKLATRMASRTSSKEHNTTGSIRVTKVWTTAIRALWAPTGKVSQATWKVFYRGIMEVFMCLRTPRTGSFRIAVNLLEYFPAIPSQSCSGGAMSSS